MMTPGTARSKNFGKIGIANMTDYEQYMQTQAWRFQPVFYSLPNPMQGPDYPYTVSACEIGCSNTNPPVVPVKKIGDFPTLTNRTA